MIVTLNFSENQILWVNRWFIFLYSVAWILWEKNQGGIGSPLMYSTLFSINADSNGIEANFKRNNGILIKVLNCHMLIFCVLALFSYCLIQKERKKLIPATGELATTNGKVNQER